MTRILFLTALLIASLTPVSHTQTTWEHPYHDGTTQVYVHESHGSRIFRSIHTGKETDLMMGLYREKGGLYEFDVINNTIVFGGRFGVLAAGDDIPNGFPVAPPDLDSILVWKLNDHRYAHILRRYDTVINSERVSAFDIFIPALDYHAENLITVVNKYGIVAFHTKRGKYLLHSMEAPGLLMNMPEHEKDVFPLCVGNKFGYLVDEECDFGIYPGRGMRYYEQSIDEQKERNQNTYYATNLGWLREGDDAIYALRIDGDESRFVSRRVSIGTPVFLNNRFDVVDDEITYGDSRVIGYVTDTATVFMLGKYRFIADLEIPPHFRSKHPLITLDKIIEGIGITVYAPSLCNYFYKTTSNLVEATVCGSTWGSSAYSESSPRVTIAVDSYYPNPVRPNHPIVFNLFVDQHSTVTCQILDYLGRAAQPETVHALYPGYNKTIITLSSVQSSGLYFALFRTDNALTVKSIYVE